MKISVCMATYNGEKYIKEQLESILSQIGENDEVIISDDSSTDNTVEIIKAFSDNRIKIYKNTKVSLSAACRQVPLNVLSDRKQGKAHSHQNLRY